MIRALLQGGYYLTADEHTLAIVSEVVNVRQHGAFGNGVSDDTPAFQESLNILRARGGEAGVLYVPRPPVAYVVQVQDYSYSDSFPFYRGALNIDFSNLTIAGDPGGSPIRLRTPGGGNPDTDFVLVPRWATDQPGAVASPPPLWVTGHAYVIGNEVRSPANGHGYQAVTNGTSGATAPSDTNPTTCGLVNDGGVTWACTDLPYRGSLFRILDWTLSPNAPVVGNITFRNLILDGQGPRRNDLWRLNEGAAVPVGACAFDRPGVAHGGATMPAGQGWSSGHQPITLGWPGTCGPVTIEDCQLINWRQEMLYGANNNPNTGLLTVRRTKFRSGTGSTISYTGPAIFEDNTLEDCHQAVECDPSRFNQVWRSNIITDSGNGFTYPGVAPDYINRGSTIVEDNRAIRCAGYGLYIVGYSTNFFVSRFKAIDCGQVAGTAPVVVGPGEFLGKPKNIQFDHVESIADTVGVPGVAFSFSVDGTDSTLNYLRVSRTPAAIAAALPAGVALVGSPQAGAKVVGRGWDFRGATGLGSGLDTGDHIIDDCLWEGLFVLTGTDLDVYYHNLYEFRPGAPTSFDTPKRFPLGREVRLLLNNQATIKNNANIVLAGGVDITPASGVGAVWLLRQSAGSQRVVETRRAPA